MASPFSSRASSEHGEPAEKNVSTCRKYNTVEGCSYGEKCRYVHKRYSKACRFFYHSGGRCQFKQDCFFSHQQETCDGTCGVPHETIPTAAASLSDSQTGKQLNEALKKVAVTGATSNGAGGGGGGEPTICDFPTPLRVDAFPTAISTPNSSNKVQMKSVGSSVTKPAKEKIDADRDDPCSMLQRKTDCLTCGTCGTAVTLEMSSPLQALEAHYLEHFTHPLHVAFFSAPEALKHLPPDSCVCLGCSQEFSAVSALLQHVQREKEDDDQHRELMVRFVAPLVERDLGLIKKQTELYSRFSALLHRKTHATDPSIHYSRERRDYKPPWPPLSVTEPVGEDGSQPHVLEEEQPYKYSW